MNFKFLATAIALMGAAATVSAQDADEIRVYINPGHGGWTANDRPMQVIGKEPYTATGTDTTSFFESNTNLLKGFGLLEKLVEMGVPFDREANQEGERWDIGAARDLEQQIVMSRVKNGPYNATNNGSSQYADNYDRSLFEICCEVEDNEFDVFVSIHSNAADANATNYHLYCYRGKDDSPGVDGSDALCNTSAVYSYGIGHNYWSVDHAYVRGDMDFYHGGSEGALGYTGYLAVLKHGALGYLVEGFFHTHTPSRHRAMNWDVDMIEGYQYARGIADYFEFSEPDPTGEIYGIVRDAHKSFTDPLYIPVGKSDDVLCPINNATVYLWKDGKKIDEYTTDNFYNGAFVFYGLEAGTYQVTVSHPDYAELEEPLNVEVTTGLTACPKVYMTDKYYYSGLPGEDLTYANLVSADEATVAESYALATTFADRPIAQLQGKTAKRMLWMKDRLYILAMDEANAATILVLDGTTGDVLAEVSTDGCTGNQLNLSDIAVTADGTLVACAKEKCQHEDKYVDEGETRGTLNFYRWTADANGVPSGAPQLWFSTQHAGDWYRAFVGGTMAYSGSMANGALIVSAENTASTTEVRNITFYVTDGVAGEQISTRPSKIRAKELGDFRYEVSPIDRHNFVVLEQGDKYGIRDFGFEHALSAAAYSETVGLPDCTTGAGFFRFADKAMMTLGTPEAPLTLYTIGKDYADLKPVALSEATFEGQAANVLTVGYPVAANSVDPAHFALMVLRDHKLSRFTSEAVSGIGSVTVDNTDQPVNFYDLNGRLVEPANLLPGIYIRRQGTHAEKIIVK